MQSRWMCQSQRQCKYLTNIGREWAKYRDLSVASCRSRIRLRQIIDLRDTEKSRYFAITESNNCFIIRSNYFREAGSRACLAEAIAEVGISSQFNNLFCRFILHRVIFDIATSDQSKYTCHKIQLLKHSHEHKLLKYNIARKIKLMISKCLLNWDSFI